MGLLRTLVAGGETRKAHPLDKPVPGAAPRQHLDATGVRSVGSLPIVKRCVTYITDIINETQPRVVNSRREVIAEAATLPEWIRQPSTDYVLEEFIAQAVWALHIDGNLKILANTNTKTGRPAQMYVGSGNVTRLDTGGRLVYQDMGIGGDIVADRIVVRQRFAIPGLHNSISDSDSAQTLLSTALHAQDAIERFFSSGLMVDHIFSAKNGTVASAAKTLLEGLARRHTGGRNAWRPLVTDQEWEVTRLSDSNQANQVLELWGAVNSAVAAHVFGLDPSLFALAGAQDKATSSLTYENLGNQTAKVWQQTVRPLARIIASAISDYLPRGQRFVFGDEELLRGSPKDRAFVLQSMAVADASHDAGLFTRDELRDVVGLLPLPEPEGPSLDITPLEPAANNNGSANGALPLFRDFAALNEAGS